MTFVDLWVSSILGLGFEGVLGSRGFGVRGGLGLVNLLSWTPNPNPGLQIRTKNPQRNHNPPQTQNLAKKTRPKRIKTSSNRESLSLKLNKFQEKTLNLEKQLGVKAKAGQTIRNRIEVTDKWQQFAVTAAKWSATRTETTHITLGSHYWAVSPPLIISLTWSILCIYWILPSTILKSNFPHR